jgi:hypothetical protein
MHTAIWQLNISGRTKQKREKDNNNIRCTVTLGLVQAEISHQPISGAASRLVTHGNRSLSTTQSAFFSTSHGNDFRHLSLYSADAPCTVLYVCTVRMLYVHTCMGVVCIDLKSQYPARASFWSHIGTVDQDIPQLGRLRARDIC